MVDQLAEIVERLSARPVKAHPGRDSVMEVVEASGPEVSCPSEVREGLPECTLVAV